MTYKQLYQTLYYSILALLEIKNKKITNKMILINNN